MKAGDTQKPGYKHQCWCRPESDLTFREDLPRKYQQLSLGGNLSFYGGVPSIAPRPCLTGILACPHPYTSLRLKTKAVSCSHQVTRRIPWTQRIYPLEFFWWGSAKGRFDSFKKPLTSRHRSPLALEKRKKGGPSTSGKTVLGKRKKK